MQVSSIASSLLPSVAIERAAANPAVANIAAQNTPIIPFQNMLLAEVDPIKPRRQFFSDGSNPASTSTDTFIAEGASTLNAASIGSSAAFNKTPNGSLGSEPPMRSIMPAVTNNSPFTPSTMAQLLSLQEVSSKI